MAQVLKRETLTAVDLALADVERRTVILRYRREKGIELRAMSRALIEGVLTEEVRREAGEVVVDDQWNQIIRDLWSNITSPYRTGAIMGHKLDHFTNRVSAAVLLGVKSFCFIQEGYLPPAVGVDLYFNPSAQEGIEAYVSDSGEIVFTDPEVVRVLPDAVRQLLQAAVLAHYQDIVCPRIVEDEAEDVNGVTNGLKQERRARTITKRRPHFRRLPPGHKPAKRQIALALCSGHFTEEQIEQYTRDGGMTYVREFVRSDEEMGFLEPRRLVGTAVQFLDIYSKLRII